MPRDITPAALLHHAFREDFKGSTVSDFKNILSDRSDNSPYKYDSKIYGRFIFLVNSCGTGKSKLVRELSIKVLI